MATEARLAQQRAYRARPEVQAHDRKWRDAREARMTPWEREQRTFKATANFAKRRAAWTPEQRAAHLQARRDRKARQKEES